MLETTVSYVTVWPLLLVVVKVLFHVLCNSCHKSNLSHWHADSRLAHPHHAELNKTECVIKRSNTFTKVNRYNFTTLKNRNICLVKNVVN